MLYSIVYKISLVFCYSPTQPAILLAPVFIFSNSFIKYVLCVCVIMIFYTSPCPYINIMFEVMAPQNVYSLHCDWVCALYDVCLRQCTSLWPGARRPSADSASVSCAQAKHCFCLLQGHCHCTHSYSWEFHGYCGQAVSRWSRQYMSELLLIPELGMTAWGRLNPLFPRGWSGTSDK